MISNSKTKKEVSCKALVAIFDAAKKKDIDINELIKGVPYDISYLLNKQERVEWGAYCKIISNSRPYFSSSEYEQMGTNFAKGESFIAGGLISLMFTSSSLRKNFWNWGLK